MTDHSKILALFPLMQTLGLILGPAIMATLVTGADFSRVIVASAVLAGIATLLGVMACRYTIGQSDTRAQ